MSNFQTLLSQTKKEISEITAQELKSWIDQKKNIQIVDVRLKFNDGFHRTCGGRFFTDEHP